MHFIVSLTIVKMCVEKQTQNDMTNRDISLILDFLHRIYRIYRTICLFKTMLNVHNYYDNLDKYYNF